MSRASKCMGAGAPAALAEQICGGDVAQALTATGNSQGTALPLPGEFNVFTTTAASTGCILPPNCSSGDNIIIVNYGAQTLSVYPPVGYKINNGSVNAAYSVTANAFAELWCIDGNNWAAGT